MKKKTKTLRKTVLWTIPIVVTLFLFSFFLYAYDFLSQNKEIIFWITGAIIIIYIAIGVWDWKKFWKGLRRRF